LFNSRIVCRRSSGFNPAAHEQRTFNASNLPQSPRQPVRTGVGAQTCQHGGRAHKQACNVRSNKPVMIAELAERIRDRL